MGHVSADIELNNPQKPNLVPIQVKAFTDTGALMLCLPEHPALQLELESESVVFTEIPTFQKIST